MTGLDEAQVRRAVGALLKHIKSSAAGKPSLLDDEGEVVLAQLSLHKIPGNVKAKPISIAIPHPLRRREDCDMCLFVKDNAKAWVKEMLENEPVEGLTKIIKLQNLRTQYHDFKDRRQLLSQFDLFLADDRILPMLTKALGKTFLSVKKQPVPVRLERRSSLAAQIARARDSAFLCGSYGDCWAVKLAHTAMTEDQVVENLMAGIVGVVDKIPKKWKNVKAVNIKCSSSVALPVYSNVGDIPPVPPAKTPSGGDVATEGKKQPGGGKAPAKPKQRKPRPLIRQQLNKLKEAAKVEKALAAGATAGGKAKGKKRAASENEEPNAGGKDSGGRVTGGSGKKVKRKRKLTTSATVASKNPAVKSVDGTKAAKKRRRADV